MNKKIKKTRWQDLNATELPLPNPKPFINSNSLVDKRLLNWYRAANTLRCKTWKLKVDPMFSKTESEEEPDLDELLNHSTNKINIRPKTHQDLEG